MCDQKVVEKTKTEEQMNMLGLKETVDGLATANGVSCRHVLRRDDIVLRIALDFEANAKRK